MQIENTCLDAVRTVDQDRGVIDEHVATAEQALDLRNRAGGRTFVVDVERGIVAIGGHLHADAEALLLDQGSHQPALWGGNYYPGHDQEDCVEYDSLINIRPGSNPGMGVEDPAIRARIRDVVFRLLGTGRPQP